MSSRILSSRTLSSSGAVRSGGMDDRPTGRFLSREECIDLSKRVLALVRGGGETSIMLESSWRGNVRWARNQISTSGDVRENDIGIRRTIRGAEGVAATNQIDNTSLALTLRRAERLVELSSESPEAELHAPYLEPFQEPALWFDRTYQLQAAERAEAMRQLVKPAEDAGMLSAGYLEVSAHGRARIHERLQPLYHPFTRAQYSVTVRDPKGTASGWAGVDWNDWGRIDTKHLSAIALEKCLQSRNPVAAEPGRYTAILEPQAVCDLVEPLFNDEVAMERMYAEQWPPPMPFSGDAFGESKIGQPVIDERITISADPTDPDLGVPPFDHNYMAMRVYHPVNWIVNGVLMELAYDREPYGIRALARNTGLPNSKAFKMSGGTTTVETMISNTRRGILVTRLSDVVLLHHQSMLLTGVTRDGLWLIENGKISKPTKNFRFTDSPLFVLNNVQELGVPQRVFRPAAPAVVPALKVQDFSFTSLSDAI